MSLAYANTGADLCVSYSVLLLFVRCDVDFKADVDRVKTWSSIPQYIHVYNFLQVWPPACIQKCLQVEQLSLSLHIDINCDTHKVSHAVQGEFWKERICNEKCTITDASEKLSNARDYAQRMYLKFIYSYSVVQLSCKSHVHTGTNEGTSSKTASDRNNRITEPHNLVQSKILMPWKKTLFMYIGQRADFGQAEMFFSLTFWWFWTFWLTINFLSWVRNHQENQIFCTAV